MEEREKNVQLCVYKAESDLSFTTPMRRWNSRGHALSSHEYYMQTTGFYLKRARYHALDVLIWEQTAVTHINVKNSSD